MYAYERNNEGLKCCTKCKNWLTEDCFDKDKSKRDGLRTDCKSCRFESIHPGFKYVKLTYSYQLHKENKKYCISCKQWKLKSEFGKQESRKDGLTVYCKECDNKRNLNYRNTHKTVWLESQQKYKINNKTQIKEYQRSRRAKDKLSFNFRSSLSKALKESKNGKHWETLVPYTLQQLKEHLDKQFDDHMTWDNYGSYWEIDHIIPKNQFNYSSYKDKEFQICWSLANLRPLSKTKNRQRPKSGSDITEEQKQQIMLQKKIE